MKSTEGDAISDRIETLQLHIAGNAHKMSRGCEPGNESNTSMDELTELRHAGELAAMAEDLVEWLVLYARDNGASWTDVGAQLGTSRQNARQRFGDLTWAKVANRPAQKWREPKLPTR